MKFILVFFYWLVQLSWGIVQNLIGFFLMLKFIKCKKMFYFGSILVAHNGVFGGISLGGFIFVKDIADKDKFYQMAVHEYGHTIQSLLFGPLYLFLVGIPSVVWSAIWYTKLKKGVELKYTSIYPENFANWLGRIVTKLEPIDF